MNTTFPSTGPQYIFVALPRCPSCGEANHKTYRTSKSSDGSKAQYALCRCCGEKFRIIWE